MKKPFKLLSSLVASLLVLGIGISLGITNSSKEVGAWNFDDNPAVAGSFNGWSTSANLLQKINDNEAGAYVYLDNGNYEFKIILNGKYLSCNGYNFHQGWTGPAPLYEDNSNFTLNANKDTRIECFFHVYLEYSSLTQVFVEQKSAYTITFNSDGGSSVSSIEKGSGSVINEPTSPTKENYDFDGWYDGSTKVTWPYTISSNKTFTAHWKQVTTKHSVTYNGNGATSGSVPTQADVAEGSTFEVASSGDLAKSGYTFGGWFDGVKIYQPGSTYTMGSSNVTLTAQWNVITYYTVCFKNEDGSTFETVNNVAKGTSVSPSNTPTKSDEGGKQYTFSKWVNSVGEDMTSALASVQSDLTVYASFTYSFKPGRYVVGIGGNWDIEHAIYMTYSDQYIAQVTLTFGELFKIAYYNGSILDSYFGYSSVTPKADAYYCFGAGESDDNIKCYAAGTYNLYFTDDNFDTYYKISCGISGDKNAQHLAAKLMSYGGVDIKNQDLCKTDGRYTTCKAIYNELSDGEKAIFQAFSGSSEAQFRNAYARYVAWAHANGEDPWTGNAVSSSMFALFGTNNETIVPIMIVIIVSIVSVSSIGAFFFFKKRKYN